MSAQGDERAFRPPRNTRSALRFSRMTDSAPAGTPDGQGVRLASIRRGGLHQPLSPDRGHGLSHPSLSPSSVTTGSRALHGRASESLPMALGSIRRNNSATIPCRCLIGSWIRTGIGPKTEPGSDFHCDRRSIAACHRHIRRRGFPGSPGSTTALRGPTGLPWSGIIYESGQISLFKTISDIAAPSGIPPLLISHEARIGFFRLHCQPVSYSRVLVHPMTPRSNRPYSSPGNRILKQAILT